MEWQVKKGLPDVTDATFEQEVINSDNPGAGGLLGGLVRTVSRAEPDRGETG